MSCAVTVQPNGHVVVVTSTKLLYARPGNNLGLVTIALSAGHLDSALQPPKSTQPGHHSVGRHNEYQPVDSDASWLGIKAGMAYVWSLGRFRG